MERSDKSSPRLDEQRKHEDQNLVEGAHVPGRDDDHLQEGIGRIEPGRQPLTAESVAGQPSIDERNERADFARWLRPSELPTTAAHLSETARDEGAPDWVVEALEELPGDRTFETIGAAWDAVGHHHHGDE
jgi:hypothetical protein